ncbi:MAG: hypothetical protein DWQ58_25360, partial [Microcystis aeruginosa TA09]
FFNDYTRFDLYLAFKSHYAFPLIMGQKSISGSPLGSPSTVSKMIEFAARHGIEPVTETYPISQVNEAMEKLRTGQPKYRLVLQIK